MLKHVGYTVRTRTNDCCTVGRPKILGYDLPNLTTTAIYGFITAATGVELVADLREAPLNSATSFFGRYSLAIDIQAGVL
jgi:hypothetical protein